MNPNAPSCRTLAFTLVELLTVIAIIGILAALLLPVLDKSEGRAKRIVCINGLEQVGLAFHTFSNDHGGKFPMAISTNDSGSSEYVQSGFQSGGEFYTAYRHFQTLSSELVFPQTLLCPADITRLAVSNFPALQNENLSYFVGVQSTFDKPTSVLAGDRNLATNSYEQPTILGLGPWSDLGWTWEIHQFKGNVLIADGHVEQWNKSALEQAEASSPGNQSLFMPTVVPELQFVNGPSSSPSGPSGPGSMPSSYQNSPSPGQFEPSASAPPAGNTAPSSQMPSAPAGQPMQSLSSSSREQLYATEMVSQAQAADQIVRPSAAPSGADTDAVVSVSDQNSGMSQFDRHMTMVMQNSLLWIYILLCILVLLYFLGRMLKRKWQRQARSRSDFQDSGD